MNIRAMFVLLSLLSLPAFAAEWTPEDYVKAYSSGVEQPKSVNESLAWAGLSDSEIFDPIEKQLLNLYLTKSDKNKVDYLSWLAKDLGFSGNPKYIATLTTISKNAKNKKLRRHADSALSVLEKYQHWNNIIAPNSGLGLTYPSTNQRLANMLGSNDFELVRIAAKRIYLSRISDEQLISIAANLIAKNYQAKGDNIFIDTIAWLCKAVANSKIQQHKPLIQQVASSAQSKKLRNYAKKYLKQY